MAERFMEGMNKHHADELASRERIAKMEMEARAASDAAHFARWMQMMSAARAQQWPDQLPPL